MVLAVTGSMEELLTKEASVPCGDGQDLGGGECRPNKTGRTLVTVEDGLWEPGERVLRYCLYLCARVNFLKPSRAGFTSDLLMLRPYHLGQRWHTVGTSQLLSEPNYEHTSPWCYMEEAHLPLHGTQGSHSGYPASPSTAVPHSGLK